jgi:phosphoadenosine phosphosulfate reductase
LPVYFIDTGYLFPETYLFRDLLAARFKLNVITLRPTVSKLHQRSVDGHAPFTFDPDLCCALNKVEPLATALAKHDVWISGVRADQTAQRRAMQTEQTGPHGILRFHPLLDWTGADIEAYSRRYSLPAHPLDSRGFTSIGCEPCTRRPQDAADLERSGRWFGTQKRECGLHTELISPNGETPLSTFQRAEGEVLR